MSNFTDYRNQLLDAEAVSAIEFYGSDSIDNLVDILIDLAALRLIDHPQVFVKAYMHCLDIPEVDLPYKLFAHLRKNSS